MSELILAFSDTTTEGRDTLLHMAVLLPKRQPDHTGPEIVPLPGAPHSKT
jgi:hypothetical protein